MESVDIEGDSIDDAIARALQRLGVSRDKVEIEIVSNATRGLFGFGGKRARVRARLRSARLQDGAEAPAPSEPARPAPALQSAPVPARAATEVARPPRPAPPPSPPAAAARPARPPRQPSRPRPRPDRPPVVTPVHAAPPPVRGEAPPPAPELLARAETVLVEIVRLIGLEATVGVVGDGDGTRLVIEGDPDGVLIGRRGQTLDAVEYVVNRIVGHDDDSPARLVVDAQGYRARRRQALEALAHRMAERARRRGKPVTLNPMNPRDRRIVHLALQGDPTLTTRSAGSGHFRKLVIVPNRK